MRAAWEGKTHFSAPSQGSSGARASPRASKSAALTGAILSQRPSEPRSETRSRGTDSVCVLRNGEPGSTHSVADCISCTELSRRASAATCRFSSTTDALLSPFAAVRSAAGRPRSPRWSLLRPSRSLAPDNMSRLPALNLRGRRTTLPRRQRIPTAALIEMPGVTLQHKPRIRALRGPTGALEALGSLITAKRDSSGCVFCDAASQREPLLESGRAAFFLGPDHGRGAVLEISLL